MNVDKLSTIESTPRCGARSGVDDRRAAPPNHGAVADFDRGLIVDVTYATLDWTV
jgi:hypothetical protein